MSKTGRIVPCHRPCCHASSSCGAGSTGGMRRRGPRMPGCDSSWAMASNSAMAGWTPHAAAPGRSLSLGAGEATVGVSTTDGEVTKGFVGRIPDEVGREDVEAPGAVIGAFNMGVAVAPLDAPLGGSGMGGIPVTSGDALCDPTDMREPSGTFETESAADLTGCAAAAAATTRRATVAAVSGDTAASCAGQSERSRSAGANAGEGTDPPRTADAAAGTDRCIDGRVCAPATRISSSPLVRVLPPAAGVSGRLGSADGNWLVDVWGAPGTETADADRTCAERPPSGGGI
eukprot:TRINITY_DN32542_c0_g1_i1.p1 TRINITY_DN32542_c0_g1~~TRINITY_DN32542_c0_g1_i1.p1  ORF type:complete len:288 (-),score=23.78 TRINITY_DN32542_c0_g1_i1:1-864(-)